MTWLHAPRAKVRIGTLAVAVSLLATGIVAPTTTLAIDTPPPAYGVQFHGTWDMYFTTSKGTTPKAMFWKHLDGLAKQKVKVMRLDIGWDTSQPEKRTPSLRHWYNQRISLVLREAAKRNIKVLATPHQSPDWSRANPGSVQQFPDNSDDIKPWATWMARTFGSQVMAWEIWNEPNLEEFTGVADLGTQAKRYVPLLKAAHDGLKAGQSNAVVVFGGPAMTDAEFIEKSYQLGAKNYFDVMSYHPYQGNRIKPPEATDLYNKSRMTYSPEIFKVMAKYGDAKKPVWWTELGYSVHPNDKVPPNEVWRLGLATNEIAADYLRRTFELARTRYPQVRLVVVYTAYKPQSDPYGHQYGYRIFNADGTALPQAQTLTRYLAGFPAQAPLR